MPWSARSRKPAFLLLLAGLALRIWLIYLPVTSFNDTTAYIQIAINWFHHGTYGFGDATLTRLPGYPLFLGLVFTIFGEHLRAALIIQVLFDLLGCILIAAVAGKFVSERAGLITLALAALCPFTAAYSASGLTECLSVFCVALAIFAATRVQAGLQQLASSPIEAKRRLRWPILILGAALAYAILLRPDGIILTVAVCTGLFWANRSSIPLAVNLRTSALCALLAILPLVPWTARNWRTFHVFQPLAPRRVSNPGQFVSYGFDRWLSTWTVEYISTIDVEWHSGASTIDVASLPVRAFDSHQQYEQTRALLARYNVDHTLTPAIDFGFDRIARARIAAHPYRQYVQVPLLRITDMGLRPRTESFDIDPGWWHFNEHPGTSAIAIGFGLLNFGYLIAAVTGFVRHSIPIPLRSTMLLYVLLRCVLLGTLENPEPRYTLEFFPLVFLCAGTLLAGRGNDQNTNPSSNRETLGTPPGA